MSMGNVFYERLVKEAEKRGISVNQIERQLNYPRNSLHNYKHGRIPSGVRLIEVAHYLDVSAEYLVGREGREDSSANLLFHNLEANQRIEMFNLCQQWLLSQVNQYFKEE